VAFLRSEDETMRIRVSSANDISGVDALLSLSYPVLLEPDYAPSVLVAALPLISKARPELLTCATYFVAERAGEIVGAGGWTRNRLTGGVEPGLGHIRHVVTDYRFVRQGIAKGLMTHVLKDAQDAGMQRMECFSTLTAVPFYAALGFITTQDVSVPIGLAGIKFPSVLMYLTF
jgi:N-acetylglutamate synthase-like GNAT family acetyltransferase